MGGNYYQKEETVSERTNSSFKTTHENLFIFSLFLTLTSKLWQFGETYSQFTLKSLTWQRKNAYFKDFPYSISFCLLVNEKIYETLYILLYNFQFSVEIYQEERL